MRDALKRYHQLGTIQLDFILPERFKLEYTGADNAAHRPVMVHRAVLGSLERFIGVFIEHCAGAFPFWLAPTQVRIVPITDTHNEYAYAFRDLLKSAGFRVDIDARNESMGLKTRESQISKIPFALVAGDVEIAAGQFAVRKYGELESKNMSKEEILTMFRELRAELAAMRGMSSRPPASDPRASSGPILPPESGPGAHAPRVLLVEDQAIVASHAARKLESEGYVVRVAASGSEACSLLSEEPDVVICDLQLGAGCSGLAVAREARQRCPGAIVVLWAGELSGLALAEAQHKTGAHAASEKGRGVQDLIAAIRSAEVSRGAK